MAQAPHHATSKADLSVRLLFTPPGGGEPLSLWAAPVAGAFVLAVDAPDIAPGWAVTGRNLSGTVAAVNGRSVEVTP